ncbi:GtrA family protein [Candidatus Peregrinibacteria bacterium]|nr:GtrA family protein [Candidatus Peregrinibacteria bacterium]
MIKLILKYIAFALIATFANISMQYAVLHGYTGPHGLLLAMFCGTLVGLVIKYILDKKFIFYFKNKKADFFHFTIYSFTGVFTTLIFWGTELLFNRLLRFESAKYIGAFIGLSIGYIIKYQLDKRFVFTEYSGVELSEFEDVKDIEGMTMIIDIDGTLVADNQSNVSLKTRETIESLKESNTVYLCTNSRNHKRNAEIERALNLKIVSAHHKKPSRKILKEMDIKDHERLVIIGDKVLTDGLFAKRIGARFIMVKRKISGKEGIHIKAINYIDDLFYNFARLFKNRFL